MLLFVFAIIYSCMSNKITAKYFKKNDLPDRKETILRQIAGETGFKPEKEIFRGSIYDADKIWSLIYKGRHGSREAVLKIQGLKPETEEKEIIDAFNGQNKSSFIRLPEILASKSWNKKDGCGYLISEYVSAPPIFKMPFATDQEMANFGKFYEDYKTKSIVSPWFKSDKEENNGSFNFVKTRIKRWQKISESKERLAKKDYLPYLKKFWPAAKKNFADIPMEFTHGHLSANDIYKEPNGKYVLMSNLFWSYRPRYYDLAFNIWACLLAIRDTSYAFDDAEKYVETWIENYKKIPCVAADGNFDRKIKINLAERMIGSILVDLGVHDFYAAPENKKYFKHLLPLHQKLFEQFIDFL